MSAVFSLEGVGGVSVHMCLCSVSFFVLYFQDVLCKRASSLRVWPEY